MKRWEGSTWEGKGGKRNTRIEDRMHKAYFGSGLGIFFCLIAGRRNGVNLSRSRARDGLKSRVSSASQTQRCWNGRSEAGPTETFPLNFNIYLPFLRIRNKGKRHSRILIPNSFYSLFLTQDVLSSELDNERLSWTQRFSRRRVRAPPLTFTRDSQSYIKWSKKSRDVIKGTFYWRQKRIWLNEAEGENAVVCSQWSSVDSSYMQRV